MPAVGLWEGAVRAEGRGRRVQLRPSCGGAASMQRPLKSSRNVLGNGALRAENPTGRAVGAN